MARILLNTKIDVKLRDELKILAEEQNRTLSNLVETTLRNLVIDRKKIREEAAHV